MITPPDGEWMSAQEALDCLELGFVNGARAICVHAFAELVQAKARRFLVHGTPAEKRSGTIGGQATSRQRLMTVVSKHLVSNSVVQTLSN